MLVSIYHLADTQRERARRQPVSKPQMLIGSDAKCDIRITDDPEVSPRHAMVVVRAGGGGELVASILVTPLAGSTLVNGQVISQDTATRLGDTLQLGNTILKFRADDKVASQPGAGSSPKLAVPARPAPGALPPPAGNPPRPSPRPVSPPPPPVPRRANAYRATLSPDPTEDGFLQAIRRTPADLETRMVYADWLEQRGFGSLAEFVRTFAHLDDPRYLGGCDVDWRAITSRTPIEACGVPQCPGAWDRLQSTTDDDRARDCATCQRRVYFIHDHFLLHNLGLYKLPFALDASVDRVSAHQFYAGAPGDPVTTVREGTTVADDVGKGPATIPDGSGFAGE